MIGKTISHYKILEKLGEGGMGVVYKAQDLKFKRVVVLKFLPNSKLGNERERARFLHEAQAAAALDHPNICTVHEIVETEEHTVIVMNLVIGRTIQQMAEDGPLEFAAAVDLAIQVAEGLQAAHAQKIIHRDVKSANIIVTRVGAAKITDFGVARLPGRPRDKRDDATVGTAAYMSPEQLEGGEVDQQSDIWSLGVVMYEMIAGRLPFHDRHESAIIYSIMNDDPEPLSSLRPDTPTALERVVGKAMAKSWGERYSSTAEMLEDLNKIREAIRAGEELETAAPPPEEAPGRFAPRRLAKSRVTWAVAAAVVVVVAAVIVFFPRKAVPFVERDWVVIADFYNATGEALLDRTLDVALAVSLDQSQYVNVVPRRRAEVALARMKKKSVDHIYEETAREIALREGVRIVVVPTITGVGDKYAMTGVIQDAETGENLRSEMVEASGQIEILDALDELVREIRSHLGEAGGSISQRSKPLQRVTTRSLSGLKQYSIGFDKHRHGSFDEARRHYEYAVDRDSTFAIALGALGMMEYLHFDRDRGIAYLERAMKYADETTELEGFSIRAAHAIAVEDDLEQAAQIYKMSVEVYPDASTNHNDLGAVYGMLGRHQDAADQYQEAIRAEPSMMIAYNGLVTQYLEHLGRVDLALEWLGRQMEYQPQSPWPYYNLAYASLGADSLEGAAAALERSLELDPMFAESLTLFGHVLRLQGRYEESNAAFARQLEADDAAVEAHYYMGIGYGLAGSAARSRDSYDRYRQVTQWRSEDNPDNAVYQIELALVLTRTGQTRGASAAADRAAAIDEAADATAGATAHFQWARLYAVQGSVDEALAQLQLAIDGGYRNVIVLKYHPDFDSIREDPRFRELIGRYLQT
jgi:tetratricopeptide (TPR) repeat protein/tRNA A-37 threonylcarbamoyl transferase component Bud32